MSKRSPQHGSATTKKKNARPKRPSGLVTSTLATTVERVVTVANPEVLTHRNKEHGKDGLAGNDKPTVLTIKEEYKVEEMQLAECCHQTHPWKTFDFEQVRNSERFAYLADPLMQRGYSIQRRRRDVFLSLFAWHNETINVWSHLLGGILFVVLFFSWFIETEPTVRLGQFAHDSVDNLAAKLNEMSTEAKKYSDALSEEADTLRMQSQALVESIALRLSSAPAELRAEAIRQQGAFSAWLADERTLLENALVTLEKKGGEWLRRVAIVEWIAVHASSSETGAVDMDRLKQVLSEKLSSFIPKDFEARRTAAALRGWLADERRTLETLLFRFDPQSTSTPVWPVLVFCFGGVMCLGCSAVYHWWLGYCRHYHDTLCRVDLAGISFMIWGSCVPLIYYVFYEDEFWRNLYLSGATLLCGATLAFTALPAELLHRVKLLRVFSYIAAGTFAIAPLVHSILRWGMHSEQVRRYLNDGYLGLVGLLYIVGAFIYVSRIPEKFYPGKFDLLFASHQIWHTLVFLAAYVHYFGAVELYLWRVETELHSTELLNASHLLG